MMEYDSAPDHYRRGYDRLETEVVAVNGNVTTRCRPAVFDFPSDADITAQDVHDAVTTEDAAAIDPFLDEQDDGFYYVSSRIYRVEAEPDIEVRADDGSVRLFEKPFDAEDPLPSLSFAEFAEIVNRVESELDLTLQPHDAD